MGGGGGGGLKSRRRLKEQEGKDGNGSILMNCVCLEGEVKRRKVGEKREGDSILIFDHHKCNQKH